MAARIEPDPMRSKAGMEMLEAASAKELTAKK